MGSIGSSCVLDCVRSSQVYDSEHVQLGDSSSSSRGPNGDVAEECVKVGTRLVSPRDNKSAVPLVPNWFQVLQNGQGRENPTETPRFDEVFQSARADPNQFATPRSNVGGEFRTPGPSPRESPRDSPRPANEDAAAARGAEVSYEGQYLGAMKHGTGRLCLNACTYEGDFMHDFKHGNGVLTWDDGRVYSGNFEYGKFHGLAVMSWPDGRKYSGQYADDKKHGEGNFSWLDGRQYDGQWVSGKRDGVGVYTNAKGITRRGTWQMDRPIQWDPAPKVISLDTATMAPVSETAQPSALASEQTAQMASEQTEQALLAAAQSIANDVQQQRDLACAAEVTPSVDVVAIPTVEALDAALVVAQTLALETSVKRETPSEDANLSAAPALVPAAGATSALMKSDPAGPPTLTPLPVATPALAPSAWSQVGKVTDTI